MKKYEYTNETKEVDGHVLDRIRAVRSFGNIQDGDLGGWIEKEDNNLFPEGNARVSDDAYVFGDVRLPGNARVFD